MDKTKVIFIVHLLFIHVLGVSIAILKPLSKVEQILMNEKVAIETVELVKDLILTNLRDDLYRYGLRLDDLLPLKDATIVFLDDTGNFDEIFDPLDWLRKRVESGDHFIFEMEDGKKADRISEVLNDHLNIPTVRVGKDVLVGELRNLRITTPPRIRENELFKILSRNGAISAVMDEGFVKLRITLREQKDLCSGQTKLEVKRFPLMDMDFFMYGIFKTVDPFLGKLLNAGFGKDEMDILKKLEDDFRSLQIVLDTEFKPICLYFEGVKNGKLDLEKYEEKLTKVGEALRYFLVGKEYILVFGEDYAVVFKRMDEEEIVERIMEIEDSERSERLGILGKPEDDEIQEFEILIDLNKILGIGNEKRNLILVRKVNSGEYLLYLK